MVGRSGRVLPFSGVRANPHLALAWLMSPHHCAKLTLQHGYTSLHACLFLSIWLVRRCAQRRDLCYV